ncbi:MAG: hypothetical protein ABIZ49_03250, partial [Opitutaceae bacterium]
MKTPSSCAIVGRWGLISLAVALPAFAQNAFVAFHDGTAKLVKRVQQDQPMVERDGRLVASSSRKFDLSRATIYWPGLVTLTDFHIETFHRKDGSDLLRLSGWLKSDASFENCFIVL